MLGALRTLPLGRTHGGSLGNAASLSLKSTQQPPDLAPGHCPWAHPQIIETFEDRQHVHIVMDYCRGGELFDRLVQVQAYTERQAAYVMHTIIETVAQMHQLVRP